MKNESKVSNFIVLPCASLRSMTGGRQGCWASYSLPKVESGRFFEILEPTYQNTRCHNPQNHVVALHWHLKPKSDKSAFIFLTYFSLFLFRSLCHSVSSVPSISFFLDFLLYCYFFAFVWNIPSRHHYSHTLFGMLSMEKLRFRVLRIYQSQQ